MRADAPHAVQVADRFYLLQNLAEALEQVLATQAKALKAVDTNYRLASASAAAGTGAVPVLPPSSRPKVQRQAKQRRMQRWKTYQKVWRFHEQGWSAPAIAQRVGLSSRTVQRYLQTSSFPKHQGRSDRGRSMLKVYQGYLLEQWNQGRRCVKDLFAEIVLQGYTGSYMTVTRYVRRLCQAQGIELRQYPTHRRLPQVVDVQRPALTARRATWLVLRKPENRTCEDEQLVAQLKEHHPDLSAAITLAEGFAQLVRQRQPDKFEPWLQGAEQRHLAPLKRFARSLREDYDAVRAGVTLSTSNGPVEGAPFRRLRDPPLRGERV